MSALSPPYSRAVTPPGPEAGDRRAEGVREGKHCPVLRAAAARPVPAGVDAGREAARGDQRHDPESSVGQDECHDERSGEGTGLCDPGGKAVEGAAYPDAVIGTAARIAVDALRAL
ncbi:hypothetical protein ACFV2N_10140 [Streptomyces sp. NPDC059680]|uniref:hypothetical protein n=1 Tax=Streptomyces sp. NPDC059680 TaxID=3346904 RepID=UPI0036BF8A09